METKMTLAQLIDKYRKQMEALNLSTKFSNQAQISYHQGQVDQLSSVISDLETHAATIQSGTN